MHSDFEQRINESKFVGDLKPILADLGRAVDAMGERLSRIEAIFQNGPVFERELDPNVPDVEGPIRFLGDAARDVLAVRLDKIEAVLLEHAKLLDPKAFNDDADFLDPPAPAEAATDAPNDVDVTHRDTPSAEKTLEA